MAAGHFKIGYGAYIMLLCPGNYLRLPKIRYSATTGLHGRLAQQLAWAVCGLWKPIRSNVSKKGTDKTSSQGIEQLHPVAPTQKKQ